MQSRTYTDKTSTPAKLSGELVAAGIALGSRFFGISYSGGNNITTVHVADDISGPEGTTIDNTVAAHVAQTLDDAKASRKSYLQNEGDRIVADQYPEGQQTQLQAMYSDALRYRPLRVNYIQPWKAWLVEVSTEVDNKKDDVDEAATIPDVNAIELDADTLINNDPKITVSAALAITDSMSLEDFLDENAQVTDVPSGVQGPFYLMQELLMREDLYGDTENPLHVPGRIQPILGVQGWAVDHASRILNIETIHGKLGWHNQQVLQATYVRPKDLLIYYGWINSFNSAQNGWVNEKVAQDMAKYGVIVFGDGVQDPTHGDYANTSIVIPRIKALNPNALIFGYVDATAVIGTFQTKATQWNTLGVHGIMMDKCGYDFGLNRADFNTRVDYVHGLSVAKKVFSNAWNTDHVLGTANDASYPNSTWNSGLVASKLNTDDWIMLESLVVNTTAYSGNAGYASKSDWYARISKAVTLRATYGVNFASVGIINDDNVNGLTLFNFSIVSAIMGSLEANGTSDTSYGASSANTKMWTRPDTTAMGSVWNLSPSIQVDSGDADVYNRYVDMAKLSLDFSSAAQASSITKW